MVRGFNLLGGGLARKQSGVVAMDTATLTIPLAPNTNINRAILRFNYLQPSANVIVAQGTVLGYLTDNNVNLFRVSAGGTTIQVYWEVLELEGVSRVQRGHLISGGEIRTSDIIALPQPVDMNRSSVFFDVIPGSTYASTDYYLVSAFYRLTSPTTLEVTYSGNARRNFAWQVVEFN